MNSAKRKPKLAVTNVVPKMTRKLAEARAVGNGKKPKFNGTAFLARLKK